MTCPPNWARLNVGGKVFQTSTQTLSRDSDSFLARLVSDNQSIPIEKDGDGAILIDRNPEYFQIVLDYLRTGRLTLSENVNFEQLMEEIDFYGLPALYTAVFEAKRSFIP
ncbi:BTB/POZ domain-containing protein KCTD17 [Aphelenchoides avenae]|nr:BTB/POZ domain-containing protein KCTD17 [Aphelenchus avenae]